MHGISSLTYNTEFLFQIECSHLYSAPLNFSSSIFLARSKIYFGTQVGEFIPRFYYLPFVFNLRGINSADLRSKTSFGTSWDFHHAN